MPTKFLLPLFLLISIFGKSQIETPPKNTKQVYLKTNALFLPIGMLNAGVEYQLSKKYTLQSDIFISPWKSFSGHEAQIYMIGFEGRYYFSEAFKHFYVGANFSAAKFVIQKWGYWNDNPYVLHGEPTPYITSNLYQKGFSLLFGATVGYQFQLGEKWNMDIYLGGGSSQGFYKGYDRLSGDRYDVKDPKSTAWDKSGEWIPYRGGVMISYKLR